MLLHRLCRTFKSLSSNKRPAETVRNDQVWTGALATKPVNESFLVNTSSWFKNLFFDVALVDHVFSQIIDLEICRRQIARHPKNTSHCLKLDVPFMIFPLIKETLRKTRRLPYMFEHIHIKTLTNLFDYFLINYITIMIYYRYRQVQNCL